MPPTKEEQRARYIQGLCVDCGEREYSAGRPRCEECHQKHQKWMR